MTITEIKRRNNPHQPVGRWIRVEKRLAIYLRDHFTCLYCGKDLHAVEDPREIQLDHLVSKVDGGSNHESNLVTACMKCNCSRQDKPWKQFASVTAREIIKRNIKRSLKGYMTLAKAIFSGEINKAEAVKECANVR